MHSIADHASAPSYTIRVFGCDNDVKLASAIEQTLLPILLRARLKAGEYKFRVKARRPSEGVSSVAFHHDRKDIVYYHHTEIINQPGIDGLLSGVLCIPQGAERTGLVDDLNAAVSGEQHQSTQKPTEENTMAKKDKRATLNGRDVIIRKSRTINVSLPHLINRVLDSLLDEANLPPGRYELMIDEVRSSPGAQTAFWLGVSATMQKGVYRLTFQLSRESQQTFLGNLTLSNRAVSARMVTGKLLEAAEVVNAERQGAGKSLRAQDPARTPEPTPAVSTATISPASTEPPPALPPEHQPTTLLEQVERLIGNFKIYQLEVEVRLQRLDGELAAKIEALRTQYGRLRQPLEDELTSIHERVGELEEHRKKQWLSKYT
jgi:hypothetical protein